MCNSKSFLKILFVILVLQSCTTSKTFVGRQNKDQLIDNSNFSSLNGEYFNSPDSLKTMKVQVKNENLIEISFCEYGDEYDSYELKGHFENGYFISNWNKDHEYHAWILIHSSSKDRKVIGLTKKGNLVFGNNHVGVMYFLFMPFFGAGEEGKPYFQEFKKKHITHR